MSLALIYSCSSSWQEPGGENAILSTYDVIEGQYKVLRMNGEGAFGTAII